MALSLEYIVTQGLQKAINEALDEEIAEALKRFESRRAEIVTTAALRMSNHMNIQTMGQTVTIEIKEIK